MKIDHEYLKGLLIAFEDSPTPDTDVMELKERGYDFEAPKFIFHMRLLDDQSLIQRTDGEPGFGFSQYFSGTTYYSVTPLRLTSKGHDFISELRQKEVWNTVKTNFKDAGITTLIEISKQLAQGFAKQKIKSITGIDID